MIQCNVKKNTLIAMPLDSAAPLKKLVELTKKKPLLLAPHTFPLLCLIHCTSFQ